MKLYLSLLFITLVCTILTLKVSAQLWTGWPVSQTTTKPFNSPGTPYSGISFSTTVTTTANTDKVLILINMNFKSASTPTYMQCKMYIAGSDANPSSDQAVASARASDINEQQSFNFFYLDSPGNVASTQYALKAIGGGIFGAESQNRNIDGIVFSNSFPIASATNYNILSVTTSVYVSLDVDISITTTSINDRVLLLTTTSMNPDSSTNIKFTYFREGIVPESGLIVQAASSYVTGKNRQIMMAYVDTPIL